MALVQEVFSAASNWVEVRGTLHWSVDRWRDWGSAVFVRKGLESVGVPFPSGRIFTAAADVWDGPAVIRVASIHVAPDPAKKRHLLHEKLIQLLASDMEGRRFVVGGDLNASRYWNGRSTIKDQEWIFSKLAERGFCDCHWKLHSEEIQSCWLEGFEGYQLDHLFVDASSADRIRACNVIDNVTVRKLSDHGPIELNLDG